MQGNLRGGSIVKKDEEEAPSLSAKAVVMVVSSLPHISRLAEKKLVSIKTGSRSVNDCTSELPVKSSTKTML
jgi:hypothetical protein